MKASELRALVRILVRVVRTRKLAEFFPGPSRACNRRQYLSAYKTDEWVATWVLSGIALRIDRELIDSRKTGTPLKDSAQEALLKLGAKVWREEKSYSDERYWNLSAVVL